MVPGIKLRPALEICYQVSCDNTGGRTVLQGGQSGVGNFYPRLLDWKAGDSLSWDLGRGPPETGLEEGFMQSLFEWEPTPPMPGVTYWTK